MRKFSSVVIRHRRGILIAALIVCAISVFLTQAVAVNYDLAGYLPKDAPSTRALNLVAVWTP